MGSGSYTHETYFERVRTREEENRPTFEYDDRIRSGMVEAKVHPSLDIHGKVRESRDCQGQETMSVAIIFDVTGSMRTIPAILQKNLPNLMRVVLDHGILKHPQILFGAVGDATCDKVPLQIGQFEADIRMEDGIVNLYCEGYGGPGWQESYQLAIEYFASRTSIDCFEKRGHKGYLFLFGDEIPHPYTTPQELQNILGVQTNQVPFGGIPVQDSIRRAAEKYHIFFIIPEGTSNFSNREIHSRWVELLGKDHVLKLRDVSLASETIGLAIGLTEGTVSSLEAGLQAMTHLSPQSHAIIREALSSYASNFVPGR